MVSAGLASAFPGLARAAVQSTTRGTQEQLALWYEQAAGAWVEALPVGNGRIGAMCFGRIAQERLQLIKDTPFAGGPYTPNNPAALSALPQVRAQTASGHFEDAAKLIERSMMGIPKTQMPYGAAGDLLLNFTGLGGATAYRRWLDLDSAICSTRFRDGKVQYKREVFASVARSTAIANSIKCHPVETPKTRWPQLCSGVREHQITSNKNKRKKNHRVPITRWFNYSYQQSYWNSFTS
jgi:alpha-L-fucosidase 2